MEIRNIAIIAHVDHGKTTLTNAILKETGAMPEDAVGMDSNAIEQERGITIYAKNASFFYQGTKINIIDTPGHADFGSEVERVLRSIDSVVLVVDAQEGPMPQTKFVLKKSLEIGLRPLVVINKVDKPAARPQEVVDEVLELFMDLGANEEQLNFQTVYASGKAGFAKRTMSEESNSMLPLLDTILEAVPPAANAKDKPLRMQPFNLGYDNYLGRMAFTRIYEGTARVKGNVWLKRPGAAGGGGADGAPTIQTGQITKIFTFHGFKKEEIAEAEAGDIVLVAGLPDVSIGDTICDAEDAPLLPHIAIDEPTICLDFMVNNSPFSGREGKFVTNSQLKERLERELEVNVGLRIDFGRKDRYAVSGRGEMHIAIFLENMRREGFELQVSQPQVIIKEVDGQKLEPFEELIIDVPEKMTGMIIEKITRRKGVMTEMKNVHGQARMVFTIPTRGLLGLRNEFMVDTSGEGIMASRVVGFQPYVGDFNRHVVGSMISMATGKALGYSLDNLQTRGVLYIAPNVEIYTGMVIGNASKGADMEVNPTKGKKLTNVRASGTDEALQLSPPWELTLERGLEIMRDDELLEITPESVRLRKQPKPKRNG